jgi:methylase of polypeptide subunit release factors
MNITDQEHEISNQHHLELLLAYLHMHDYQFITISPASHERVNNRIENAMGNDLVDIFGWNRPFKPETVDTVLFDLMHSANIITKVENGLKSQLRVSSLNGKLFLHSAFPTSSNEAVFFGPDSYRFVRVLYQYLATNQQPIHRAVDIGTGSGVGAVMLALALPESEIIAVDINHAALNLARANIAPAGMHHIELVHSDLLNNVAGSFDLIIANPPYLLDESERVYRHGGGPLGAALSLDIVDTAIERLNPNGTLLLYTGVVMVNGYDAFLAEVSLKLDFAGFAYEYSEVDPDIFGEELDSQAYRMADRIAAVVLIARNHSI